jgi:hypothetical protein
MINILIIKQLFYLLNLPSKAVLLVLDGRLYFLTTKIGTGTTTALADAGLYATGQFVGTIFGPSVP